ncbi:hypothetical protein BaRGS_00002842, partial [Batillaria attramentaria]
YAFADPLMLLGQGFKPRGKMRGQSLVVQVEHADLWLSGHVGLPVVQNDSFSVTTVT